MCGITGIANFKDQVRHPMSILPMREALKHRGPDSKAAYISPNGKVVFGHRRLSLVGLDRKATIMSIPKRDSFKHEVAIVFNGEIYNFKELKKYFTKKGYVSVSPSDFEVIIFAWQEWGKKCVDHLIGEFIFVIYDEQTEELFIARDRTGVKPLFYAFTPQGEFVFGSEPKAVLKYPELPRKIDSSSVAEFLLMSHTFAAGSQNESASYYQGVKQIPPAHCAWVDNKGIHLQRYYQLPFTDHTEKNLKTNIKKVKQLLTKSVIERIPDEVPVSVGLSGGLDSSIVSAVAVRSDKGKGLLNVCVRYSGDRNNDYNHAKIIAEKDKMKLDGPIVSPEKMMEYVDVCIWSLDGPVDSIRRMGMHANYKFIKEKGYRATLIGEGADEMNLGYYHTFPGLKVDREYCKNAEALAGLFHARVDYVRQFFTKDFLRQIDYKRIVSNIIKENYLSCPSKNPVTRMQYFYAKRFLQYLEDGNDRASMTNSVEARLPFLDPELIKACVSVPMEQNIVNDGEKNILREAFKDVLPKEIYARKKSPFPANEDMRLHKLISSALDKEIKKANSNIWKILDEKFISNLSKSYSNKIKELEEIHGENNGGQFLTAWLPISGPVELRTNQLFSVLTLIKWLGLETA